MCDLVLILPFTIVEEFTKHNIIYTACVLFCICSSCVPYVASSLDCPFLIATAVFSNVYI